jgi:hypothetical protein
LFSLVTRHTSPPPPPPPPLVRVRLAFYKEYPSLFIGLSQFPFSVSLARLETGQSNNAAKSKAQNLFAKKVKEDVLGHIY